MANALQLRRQPPKHGQASSYAGEDSSTTTGSYIKPALATSASNALAAAFSLGTLTFSSQSLKSTKLALTPHHLYYLLCQFEELGIPVGSMTVRLENIHTEASPANYVSFLSEAQRPHGRSDRDSIHSVTSVRSVVSGMSKLWSGIGTNASMSAAKNEKAKAQQLTDLKYLYSAFTKIPCLRLSPDRRSRLIRGYEEFPFDTAVPLFAFKNLSALEICDIDFRQFYGWDRMADQLRSLTVKRSCLDDPTDLFVNIVLDDMDKRRRRSSKAQSSPVLRWPSSPSLRFNDVGRTNSIPPSPIVDDRFGQSASPKHVGPLQVDSEVPVARQRQRTKSSSPSRPSSSRQDASYRHIRGSPAKVKRSGSASSNSSTHSSLPLRSGSSSNLLTIGFLPASKWRFLRHLSLADNSLTSMTASSLGPLSNTLHSLDLSSNLFAEVPDCLVNLSALRALNLSNCMIDKLHSLTKSPLPAITALNLRANRLTSIAGVERLLSLERLDLRDNRIQDPTELARLTSIPNIHEIWVLQNPFIKTHNDYRITIFNLFRGTPGYCEDIVIDTTAPGYSERRQLRERAVESQGNPVVKAVDDELALTAPSSPDKPSHNDINTGVQTSSRSSTAQATQNDTAAGSNRRRKGLRRRIVDLAQDEGAPGNEAYRNPIDASQERQSSTEIQRGHTFPTAQSSLLVASQADFASSASDPSEAIHSSTTEPIDVSDKGRSLATEIKNLNLNGEAYRQKIEALKNEVGSNWLSVLSEEGWQQHQEIPAPHPRYNHIGVMRPHQPGFRAVSQGIMSGTRTIG